jgi:hypothetical protein
MTNLRMAFVISVGRCVLTGWDWRVEVTGGVWGGGGKVEARGAGLREEWLGQCMHPALSPTSPCHLEFTPPMPCTDHSSESSFRMTPLPHKLLTETG